MRVNRCRQKLLAGETVFGCAIQQYGTPEIARAMAAAGFDWLFIDMEHGPFDMGTVQQMIGAAVGAGITPLVRVGEPLYSLVCRALDIGAQGIVLPRLESPEVLAEAVSWTRYPPAGKRGFGMMPPVLDYEPLAMRDIVAHMNANTLVVAQFESRLALERAGELLSVPGVDVAMVGPADLSISLGVPGELDHPVMIAAIDGLIAECGRRGVVPGIHCRGAAQAAFWAGRGMRFAGAGGEHAMLLEKAREAVGQLRGASRPAR